MTAIAEPRAPHPRSRGIRPAALLASCLIVVLLSYAAATFAGHAGGGSVTTAKTAGDQAGAPAAIPQPGGPLPIGSLAQIDHSIGIWTANLAAEPRDFLSATYLGLVYEGRGRLTGDIGDYQRARDAAERALAIVPADPSARILHARLLQTTHDFPGALAEAEAVVRDDPTQLPALATEGDAKLELGDVDGAAQAFEALASEAPGPAVTARLSRLAFIRGDTASAVTLATRAYDEALAAAETGPSLGWYAYLAGIVALSTGAPTDATTWFDRAVGAWPDSYLALAGQARAEAALGHTDQAIATYSRAIAIAPQPDALTALGDLYALRGDAKLAADQYATVEAIGHLAAINQQVYNRQLVLFSVNHDRDLADALRLAEQELAVRKDVYGYDADAWALLANGRPADADAAIRRALAFGTKDALLSYHAGMIALALGDTARASSLLQDALALTGALDPLAASQAATALASLR
jgi:tetratricopeptide (TPR) repeat protein